LSNITTIISKIARVSSLSRVLSCKSLRSYVESQKTIMGKFSRRRFRT
jgi:hypothetical protein